MMSEQSRYLSVHEEHSGISGGLASRVLLDRVHGTAIKKYDPPWYVRLLYWLAFQAPFPYVRNEASLRAARARRIIASRLTEFWFGTDHVAATIDINCDEEGCIFVTQLIEGEVPKDKKKARAFLRKIASRFQEVGLPTWQVDPLNPKAPGNIIETPDGDYKIIDLESGVASPMMPIGQWIDAIKAGMIPVFDDVFVDKTRTYIEKHASEIEAAVGPDCLRELQQATDEYQDCAEQWQAAELRIWSKLLRALMTVGGILIWPLKLLWPPTIYRAIRAARGGREQATNWARGAVERLVEEGSLDREEADKALRSLEAPETLAVLGHLGAHIAISIPLRFPLGSIVRFGWTVFFRLRIEVRALLGRVSREELRGARGIHTLTVAVLSALPGLGTFAYIVAEPLRKNRPLLAVLLDEALRKIPFRLYERQHLAVLTCWLACSGPGLAPRMVKDRWHLLRPHHVIAWVKESIGQLGPHLPMVAVILVVDVVALSIAGTVFLLTTDGFAEPSGASWAATFGEFGPIQTLKAGQLLLSGLAGYVLYHRFWRLPQAGQRVDAPGSYFWILSGAGLAWLGVDDYFQIHERLGDVLEEGFGVTIPLLNNPDDIFVLGYAVIALTMVAIFLGELLRSRSSFPLLVTGFGFLVLSLAVDFFVQEGTSLAGVEDPTNVVGTGFILSAYLVKLREVSSELPGTMNSLAPGGLPSVA